jgi:hypothetical protein
MGSEFSVWLLLVGMVAGGALTWLVLAELGRRDEEIREEELRAEATWLVGAVGDPRLDPQLAEDILHAHRRYLGFPPPDALISPDDLAALELAATASEAAPAEA